MNAPNHQQLNLFNQEPPAPCSCDRITQLAEQLEQMSLAFPGGDTAGHRLYHEEVIASMKARKEFWQKLTFELVKWGLLGFLGWMILQIWKGVLLGPKGG